MIMIIIIIVIINIKLIMNKLTFKYDQMCVTKYSGNEAEILRIYKICY